MSEPLDWFGLVCHWCQSEGLPLADAEDCVWEVFERYQRRHKAYPWEEQSPDLGLLRQKAHDVSMDFKRKQVRRERLLEQAAVFLPRATVASPEQFITELLDEEAFLVQLPKHLRDFARLRQSGCTLLEAAGKMNITLGTAKRYNHEIKSRLAEFYGFDTTFLQGRVGINSGNSRKRKLPYSKLEVTKDETIDKLASATDAANDCNSNNRSDPNPESSGGGADRTPGCECCDHGKACGNSCHSKYPDPGACFRCVIDCCSDSWCCRPEYGGDNLSCRACVVNGQKRCIGQQ
ncbi:hypothetical protein HRbin15_02486 [bacterium HR15]|nr:hypothetical protein HRbin15_02486 [bacterium HR15]